MRVGIYLDLRNPPAWRRPWAEHYKRSLELVEEAERLGAHSVWLSEHHLFEDGYLPQPLTFAAALAARTNRMRIGTAIMLPALRQAVHTAEEAAIVDILSNGRLDLGFGVGYRVPEYEAFGADLSRRYETFEERVVEIRALWTSGVVTPPPVQQPIPMWGGFFGPRGARMAGRLGMGLLSASPDIHDHYRAGLREGGHGPERFRVAQHWGLIVADDPEAAWPRIKPHLAYQWDSYGRYMVEGTGAPALPPTDADAMRLAGPNALPAFFQILTADEAVAFIKGLAETSPLEEIFFWASVAGMPADLEERHVELVCSTVRRAVADAGPAKVAC